ncbi:MAG: hypothetical protein Q4G09_05815 [Clostridia bacterium]|nr:hypothetical protein [Clostridia bacterium]
MKENKGITLVALVITIIVMLILTGVGIKLTIDGESIEITENAVNSIEQQAAKQRVLEILSDYEAIREEELLDYLNEKVDEKELDEVIDNEDGTYTIIIGENEIIIDVSEYIIVPESREGLNIGDYVDYRPSTTTNARVIALNKEVNTCSGYDVIQPQNLSQEEEDLKWQILNIYENGTVDLVSTETTERVGLAGAQGYNNGVYLLNHICSILYSNSTLGVEARSINLKDIEKHLTQAGINARNLYSNPDGFGYGDTKTFSINYSYYPNLYEQENGSGINIDPNPTETIRERLKTNGIDNSNPAQLDANTGNNAYKQANAQGLTITNSYYDIPFNVTNCGALFYLFENSSFWLATRYVSVLSSRFFLRDF